MLLKEPLKFTIDIKLKSKNGFSINKFIEGQLWKNMHIKIPPYGSPVFSLSGTGMEKIFWFFI